MTDIFVKYLAPIPSANGKHPVRHMWCEFDTLEQAENWAKTLIFKYKKGTVKIFIDGKLEKRVKLVDFINKG